MMRYLVSKIRYQSSEKQKASADKVNVLIWRPSMPMAELIGPSGYLSRSACALALGYGLQW